MQPSSRSTPRPPGSFSPLPASTTNSSPTRQNLQDSVSSDELISGPLNISKTRTPQPGPSPSATPIYAAFTSAANSNNNNSNPQNFSRPAISTAAVTAARSVTGPLSPADPPRNVPSPLASHPATPSPITPTFASRGVIHNRKNSQNAGLFEPTLPSTSTSNLSNLGQTHSSPKPSPSSQRDMSASYIAAQAAVMQHQNQQQQQQQQQQPIQNAQQQQDSLLRQRSQTASTLGEDMPAPPPKRGSGGSVNMNPPLLSLTEASVPRDNVFGNQAYHNGLLGNPNMAAAAAANLVFPKSASTQASPAISTLASSPQPPPPPPPVSEKPPKPEKEKSKVKLFARQVKIGSRSETKEKPLPSPGKVSHAFANLQRANFSTTSLDSSALSFYNLPNSSTATIRPAEMPQPETKEKEKKHHFLSRQKNKLKDLKDDHHLPLSSAMSNSRPTDPSAPSSLYNFNLPPSPAPNATSFKSALDLRHGARALREKRKEEKALDEASSSGVGSEWPGPGSVASGSGVTGTALYLNEPFDSHKYGLHNMTHDDAWPFLKAKLLIVFEAEDLRLPVEDLNRVVSMHLQYCVARRSPNIIVDDLRDLLATGFSSLDQTLRKTPEDKLIPALVELWIFTFTSILPYMQAVFLPLDLEFAGNGPLMGPDQAREFWSAIPGAVPPPPTSDNNNNNKTSGRPPTAASVLEVRRFVLLAFRDIVILPRYETLKTMFSRLSLEFLPQALASNALASPPLPIPSPGFHNQQQQYGAGSYSGSPSDALAMHASSSLPNSLIGGGAGGGYHRPGTAASLDPSVASYNSTSTTLLGGADGGSSVSGGNRSRAISNVSYGSDSGVMPGFHTTAGLRPFGAGQHYQHHPGFGVSPAAGSGGGIWGPAAAAASSALHLVQATTNPSGIGPSGHYYRPSRDQNVEDSKQVTEMVGRMLQCMSVLASVGVVAGTTTAGSSSTSTSSTNANAASGTSNTTTTTTSTAKDTVTPAASTASVSTPSATAAAAAASTSSPSPKSTTTSTNTTSTPAASTATIGLPTHDDEGNKKIEELNKLLKLNWLGRGRTGRNRRGIVGGRAAGKKSASTSAAVGGGGGLAASLGSVSAAGGGGSLSVSSG
ncbi:hypothetical protein VTJ04DRAFT_8816 [Mycothermus thermophilus]|uniref:uncharacterized protein n=1 Tax=Humicola insolens TaxID=85995 RepID=UPI003742473A